jgi:hypothetical protein
MAYSNGNANNGNQRKSADGFMNIWFKMPNGEFRKVGERGVALYASNAMGKSILEHIKKQPDFEFQVVGRVTPWNPDREVDVVDLFGTPAVTMPAAVNINPGASTEAEDKIPF